MVEFIAAAGAAAAGLFSYNRKNYMFDAEMKIKREYQGQDMREYLTLTFGFALLSLHFCFALSKHLTFALH